MTIILRNGGFAPLGRRICPLALLWLSIFLPAAYGATRVSGSLSHPHGNAVPGATIGFLRRADSSRNQTQTDDQGQFSFDNLQPGEYTLTAEFAGFAPITKAITISDEATHTATLQFSTIATQQQSVTVMADVSDVSMFS